MKTTLLLLAPFFLATTLATTGPELVFEPEEGTVLTRSFVATVDMDLVDYTATLDGDELELNELELKISSVETIEVTDELVGVEDNRPTEIVRTFDELTQEATVTANGEESEQLSTSALEGRSLRFEWDEDAEYYTIETADENGDLDDETLEWLEEDMDLRAVLPEDEVEVGDSWEIDEGVYLPLMWPGGLLDFSDEEEEEEVPDYRRELNQETIENLTGEGEATFENVREEGGVRVAVIRIDLEIETDASATESEGPADVDHGLDISRRIEGVILWDLDHGHLFSVELEAEVEMTRTRTRIVETEEVLELEEEDRFEGELTYEVFIERE
ncbi:MAG: hypothetical protein CMJ89_11045 [Planctomycetes bacterium]|jgi:hypothetical protein|nr:hypothetical protein [Planctomycetota bacterium]